jgi:hypothetical protein
LKRAEAERLQRLADVNAKEEMKAREAAELADKQNKEREEAKKNEERKQ